MQTIINFVGTDISFSLLATEKICTMLGPDFSTAASIMRISKEFLVDKCGLNEDVGQEGSAAALSSQLQTVKQKVNLIDSLKVQ